MRSGWAYGLVCLALVAWCSAASAQTIEVEYYTPEYYLDQPVFFDQAGQPIYYVEGVAQPVPRTYVNYRALLRHYRQHRSNYEKWYRAHGSRFHGHRRAMRTGDYPPVYHDGYLVFFSAAGVPFYYVGSRKVVIERTHPSYGTYVGHYKMHAPKYRAWYQRDGRAYHGYRQAPAAGRIDRRVVAPQPVAQPAHPGRPGHPGHPGARLGRPAPAPVARPIAQPAAHPGHPGHPGARRGPGQPATARPPARVAPRAPGEPVDCRQNPGHPMCRKGRPGR